MSEARGIGSDLLAAGAALVIGLIGLVEGSTYAFGTIRQIGPAVFPVILSAMMVGCAGLILLEWRLRGVPDYSDTPRPLRIVAGVFGGPLAFALLIENFGLVPAIFGAVAVSSVADPGLTWKRALAVAVVLSAVCVLIFIELLGLNLRIAHW